jgi:hypothetical protein
MCMKRRAKRGTSSCRCLKFKFLPTLLTLYVSPRACSDASDNSAIMSRCMLVSLPQVFFRRVLVEWLRLKDVTRLDSAICSRELRVLFLTLAYNRYTIYGAMSQFTYEAEWEPILKWAVVRKAQLDGIIIDGRLALSQDLLLEFFSSSGPAVRCAKISSYRLKAAALSQKELQEVQKWCPNVQHLDVCVWHTEVPWGEQIIAFTKSHPKLLSLALSCNPLTEKALASALSHCECLQSLAIYNPVVPEEIAIPTLKSIRCDFESITEAVLFAIGRRCTILETLIMFKPAQYTAEHFISNAGVRAVLQGCPLLWNTDVHHAEYLSRELWIALVRRRNMRTFNTDDWERMDNELAQELLKASPNLTTVSFQWGSDWLTDATLAVCARYCLKVATITATGCPLISNESVQLLASSLASNLRSVRFDGCPQLSDDAVLAIAEHCPLLERVAFTASVSDAAVVKLAESCAELRYVYLNKTQVGDAGLTALATHLVRLEQLYLYDSPHVTMRGVRALAKHCRRLTHLGLPRQLSGKRKLVEKLVGKTLGVVFY